MKYKLNLELEADSLYEIADQLAEAAAELLIKRLNEESDRRPLPDKMDLGAIIAGMPDRALND